MIMEKKEKHKLNNEVNRLFGKHNLLKGRQNLNSFISTKKREFGNQKSSHAENSWPMVSVTDTKSSRKKQAIVHKFCQNRMRPANL